MSTHRRKLFANHFSLFDECFQEKIAFDEQGLDGGGNDLALKHQKPLFFFFFFFSFFTYLFS